MQLTQPIKLIYKHTVRSWKQKVVTKEPSVKLMSLDPRGKEVKHKKREIKSTSVVMSPHKCTIAVRVISNPITEGLVREGALRGLEVGGGEGVEAASAAFADFLQASFSYLRIWCVGIVRTIWWIYNI